MNEEEHKIEQHIADWSTKDKEKFQKLVDQCGIPLIIQAFHYLEQEENEITYKSVKSALRELEEAAETDVTKLPDQNTQTNEVETTLDTADSDEVQGVDDLKGEISETVYPQKDRRYYSEYVEKLLDNQEIEGFALRDYQKRITLDMSDFVDAPSKAAALTLLVGGGKSKMTPVFGLLANAKGKRFVACCYNNTLLLELLKGIRETFGEIYVNGENLLVIPSLENAYRVFFNVAVSKDGETGSETDATKGLAEYLYPKTKEDEEQIAQWIVRCKTYADEETRKKMAEKLSIRDLKKGSQKKGKKEWKKHICSEYERKLYLLSKQADKADKAFRSLLDVLKK